MKPSDSILRTLAGLALLPQPGRAQIILNPNTMGGRIDFLHQRETAQDSDGDGWPDGWEIEHDLDPSNPNTPPIGGRKACYRLRLVTDQRGILNGRDKCMKTTTRWCKNDKTKCFLALTLLMATTSPSVVKASVLTVTDLGDSGPGTLRDSIAAANPGDEIVFNVPGTVWLNSELTISKNLRLLSDTEGLVRISGNNNSRVFHVTGANVQFFNLAITDGRVVGTNGVAGSNGENVGGAGLLVEDGAGVVMEQCVVSNNVVVGGRAGSGAVGGNGFGGGIKNLGFLGVGTCLVVSNAAFGGSGGAVDVAGQAWGGGVYTEGTFIMGDTTFHANLASGGQGGGGNGSGAGGGIYNVGAAFIGSSTIVSNAAASLGIDFGGGIDNYGELSIEDSTIFGNQADYGGGITGGNIVNTILAGNQAGTGPDGSGSILSGDYNLIQNTSGISFSGTTTHNLTGVDPKLGPLRYNDGPPLSFEIGTLAPLPGSPVIDQGKNANTSTTDQRGFPRPYDGSIANAAGGNGADIGAVEVNPGTLLVLNTNDNGTGSLRQALLDNAGLGGDNTIGFASNVVGTITLTSELRVDTSVTVRGPGADVLAVSGDNRSRVFTVIEGRTSISDLTIRDGLVRGGDGDPMQDGGDARGGGIFNQSTLFLGGCVVLSNRVVGGKGGPLAQGSVGRGGKASGGGIYSAGETLQISQTKLSGNKAQGGGGGDATDGEGGEGANGLGGGICTIGGVHRLIRCTFENNQAVGGAGGSSGGSGSGGVGGQGYGAGFYSESSGIISLSTLHGGQALGGAGGAGSAAGNDGSGYGGGIYTVLNLGLYASTIANNSAAGSAFDFGGGLYNVGTLGITNSTVARNQADFGGGLSGDATAANTMFAGNTAGFGADVAGIINSLDYNLIQSFAGASILGATAHTLVGLDPLLGPLGDNGGLTPTMALLPGSPAIDQGKNLALAAGLTIDQRGVVRPYDLPSITNAGGGDGSDIGAFEFLPTPRLNILGTSDSRVVLFWSTDAADYRLQSVTNLPAANAWLDVDTPKVIVGNQVYTTNAVAGRGKFYRLIFP